MYILIFLCTNLFVEEGEICLKLSGKTEQPKHAVKYIPTCSSFQLSCSSFMPIIDDCSSQKEASHLVVSDFMRKHLTCRICKLGFNQNCYTFTSTSLTKIVLCSEIP